MNRPLNLSRMLIAIGLFMGSFFPAGLNAEDGPPWNLESLIEEALENESSLASLHAEKKAAAAQLQSAKARRWPKIGLEASSSFLSDSLLSVEQGVFGTLPAPAPPMPLPAEDLDVWGRPNDFRYDISAWLEQPIYSWGKIEAGIQSAQAAAMAAHWKTLARELELRAGILTATESLSLIDRMLALAAEQEKLGERLSELTRDNFRAGFLLETEYRDTRDRLRQIVISRSALDDERRQLVLRLSQLTGLADLSRSSIILPAVDDTLQSYRLPDTENLVARAWARNPELQQLGTAINYAASQLKLARASRNGKPDLAFRTEFSYSGGYGRSPDELDGSWTLSLGVRTTLFDGAAAASKLSQAEYQLQAARLRSQAARSQLETAIRSALYRMELNRSNIEYYIQLEETDRLRSEERKDSWNTGYGREDEWLLAEIDRLASEMLRLKEISLYLRNERELRRLTGLLP